MEAVSSTLTCVCWDRGLQIRPHRNGLLTSVTSAEMASRTQAAVMVVMVVEVLVQCHDTRAALRASPTQQNTAIDPSPGFLPPTGYNRACVHNDARSIEPNSRALGCG
jgi:hypothetical protein